MAKLTSSSSSTTGAAKKATPQAPTRSPRELRAANRRAAAKVYIKASTKIGEPVPQKVRDLAADH